MDKDAPSQTIVGTYIPPQPAREAAAPAQPAAPLYRVTDGDGKDVSYETTWRDGVLTVTVEADRAVLTGRLSGIASLQAQGIERIVFITKGATSEFLTADLLGRGPGHGALRPHPRRRDRHLHRRRSGCKRDSCESLIRQSQNGQAPKCLPVLAL